MNILNPCKFFCQLQWVQTGLHMSKFSLNLSDELEKMVDFACSLSGRSRNSACVDWILRGVLEELESYKKAGFLPPTYQTPLQSPEDKPEE
ncbi:MAG: hypothetical protein KA714_29530 [Limnoraphis sp. WC205]|jgi:hypothetical protein|nr:hypothetical protein [Limnoraphis sp. WC205]